jgi:hypothetical protein
MTATNLPGMAADAASAEGGRAAFSESPGVLLGAPDAAGACPAAAVSTPLVEPCLASPFVPGPFAHARKASAQGMSPRNARRRARASKPSVPRGALAARRDAGCLIRSGTSPPRAPAPGPGSANPRRVGRIAHTATRARWAPQGVGAPASAAGASAGASAAAPSGSGDSAGGVELPQAYATIEDTNTSAMIFKLLILQSYSPCDFYSSESELSGPLGLSVRHPTALSSEPFNLIDASSSPVTGRCSSRTALSIARRGASLTLPPSPGTT